MINTIKCDSVLYRVWERKADLRSRNQRISGKWLKRLTSIDWLIISKDEKRVNIIGSALRLVEDDWEVAVTGQFVF